MPGALRRLRNDLILALFEQGFLGGGQFSSRPPVSERGAVVQALGHAFRLRPGQILRIVQAKERERRAMVE